MRSIGRVSTRLSGTTLRSSATRATSGTDKSVGESAISGGANSIPGFQNNHRTGNWAAVLFCAPRTDASPAMLTALLTDIHANLEALSACLDHARRMRVERYAFLGDLVGYGADPGPVVDVVRA